MTRQQNFNKSVGLLAGPAAAAALLLFFDLQPDNPLVTRAAAVAVLMAVWWVTEAIPLAATAMLPVALFPLLGVLSGKETASAYFNDIIFLFIGGFIVALAMQEWNLHRRIALRTILLVGVGPKRLMFGFMAATAFLAMWVSNTATTMMMMPIAMAVILKLKESFGGPEVDKMSTGLLLGVAYAASIGGIATLIGTPPNMAFAKIYAISFPGMAEITFAEWIVFGFPCSAIFLVIMWWLLSSKFVSKTRSFEPDMQLFRQEYNKLGKMSFEEKVVTGLFAAMVALWLFRKSINLGFLTIPGWSELFPQASFIDDGTVAIIISLALFVFPSKSIPGKRIIDWHTAGRLHWGVVILFGGGFALAKAFESSGLSVWIGQKLAGLSGVPDVLIVIAICTMMTFLTELTSNTATTQMSLPLLASLSAAIGVHPLLLMVPATLSASCAFMLPVATPPNAIVFGTGEITMKDMMRMGIRLNLIGIVLITAMMYLLGIFVFGIK